MPAAVSVNVYDVVILAIWSVLAGSLYQLAVASAPTISWRVTGLSSPHMVGMLVTEAGSTSGQSQLGGLRIN